MFRSREMFGTYNSFGEMITTMHTGHGNDMAMWGQDVRETYQTLELRGNFYFFDKWRTTIILPFVHNVQRLNEKIRYRIYAPGDPMVLQSYRLYNTMGDTSNQGFTQRWLIGGGLRMPFGQTDMVVENATPNLDLQPGKGSWGSLFYTTLTIKYKWLGLRNNLSFLHNGKDEMHYQYGQTLNWMGQVFADLTMGKKTLRLQVGTYYEKAQMDRTRSFGAEPGMIHHDTGGKIWFGQTGLRLFMKNMQFFSTYEHAMSIQLNGFEQLLTRGMFNAGATWYF